MKKHLRLLRERSQQPFSGPDLRQVGDRELFEESVPCPVLHVVSAPKGEWIHSLCKDYGLTSTETGDHLLLTSKATLEPNHKFQALALFVAAMDLQASDPHCRSILLQHSGLHELLKERTRQHRKNHPLAHEAHFAEFMRGKSRVTVDSAISHLLHQAGLPVPVSEGLHHFDSTALAAVRESLQPATHATRDAQIQRVG